MQKLHLIEPTLADQTGHGYSYNSSLVLANKENYIFDIELWIDNRAKDLFSPNDCKANLYFNKKFKLLQKIFLFRKLLNQPDIIYICTASLTDLIMLNLLHNKIKSKAKIYLHFHQFNQTTKKLNKLKKISSNSDLFNIFTPTQKLSDIFVKHGFTKVKTVPCPTFLRTDNNKTESKTFNFKKVLYAGAARSDKGFLDVINFIKFNNIDKQNKDNLQFDIQVSPPHSGRYDEKTTIALDKLNKLKNNNIKTYTETLNQEEYLNMFPESICLLLYDQNSYSNKFSGVTLDAFYAGCPIITANNTWMGDTVTKFNAGIALDDYRPNTVYDAVNKIKNNYNQFAQNAYKASQLLAIEHHPINTLKAIRDSN